MVGWWASFPGCWKLNAVLRAVRGFGLGWPGCSSDSLGRVIVSSGLRFVLQWETDGDRKSGLAFFYPCHCGGLPPFPLLWVFWDKVLRLALTHDVAEAGLGLDASSSGQHPQSRDCWCPLPLLAWGLLENSVSHLNRPSGDGILFKKDLEVSRWGN